MFDDYNYDDEYYFKQRQDALDAIADIKRIQEKNFDPRPKVIGDRVEVWDWSSCTDLEGNDLDNTSPEAMGNFIVVSNNANNELTSPYSDLVFVRDLVLYSMVTKHQVRVCSKHVKLVEGE